MTTESDEIRREATSEDLAVILQCLTTDQIRFVIARQEHNTDKDAALSVGIPPATVKEWKYRGDAPLDEAVRLMAFDGVTTALELRKRALSKAMAVKVKGLDERDDKLRQSVATEIIEWELGKATQRQETDLSGSIDLGLDDAADRFDNMLARLVAARSADGDSSGEDEGSS